MEYSTYQQVPSAINKALQFFLYWEGQVSKHRQDYNKCGDLGYMILTAL